jgi:hypothetical protein
VPTTTTLLVLTPFTRLQRPVSLGWAEWQALSILSVHSVFLHTGDLSLFTAHYPQMWGFTELALVNASNALWTCNATAKPDFDCTQPEVIGHCNHNCFYHDCQVDSCRWIGPRACAMDS